MSVTRLVFETTEAEKAALAAALEPAGKSFTDWFEEQLAATLSAEQVEPITYVLEEAGHPGDLADPIQVAGDLSSADWSFFDSETAFLTHDVHPYPAKYIPQIPANLIRRLSCPGELVLDPFGGSGTTATEAVRMGRRAVSVDANPLATLIGRVKTSGISAEDRVQLARLATAVQTYLIDATPAPDAERLKEWVPDIPNVEKWFQPEIVVELACIRRLITELTSGRARDIASLALSRIIVRVSNQDSETRYVAKDKRLAPRVAFRAFLDALGAIQRKAEQFAAIRAQGTAEFHTSDSRQVMAERVKPESVGLIVSSPPYPNATDYHLYHRFRIFWLGHDPRDLGSVEIGSHLKHQRKQSGFDEYADDMREVMTHCFTVLSAGRFAVFVVGDAMFGGEITNTADKLQKVAEEIGFEHVVTVERPLHATRRSFVSAARRARNERLLVLRKPDRSVHFDLSAPNYRLWGYEELLREQELTALFGEGRAQPQAKDAWSAVEVGHMDRWKLGRLTFSSAYSTSEGLLERTWQKLLENGDSDLSRKKEPKYVTHGIHAYKGKFYPQLAKALLNISGVQPGGVVLDPFCGSGTVVLEGYLNGFQSYGCDVHPLAVKIGRAKTEVLSLPARAVDQALSAFRDSLGAPPSIVPSSTDQFSVSVEEELFSWFPDPVVFKLNWLLGQIRLFGDARIVNFLEVILSDCIREASQQEPTDLRIRRRAVPIEDSPIVEAFTRRLEIQHSRLRHFWSIASRRPAAFQNCQLRHGDNRQLETLSSLGLAANSVDVVVTSPPYATALPYIDTDRLSLMAILGMPSAKRRVFEDQLTGSREIGTSMRAKVEEILFSQAANEQLPKGLITELRTIHKKNIADGAGFRKLNMPALLFRYFNDMAANLQNVAAVLKSGGSAYYVVGDSKTEVAGEWFPIRTTSWLMRIAETVGLESNKLIDISVTTENMKHIRHAITENAVLRFKKP